MAGRHVVITGLGAVTPFGIGAERFWQHISKGDSGASLITSFDVSTLPVKFAAPVPNTDDELQRLMDNPKSLKTMSRAAVLAAVAASEAFQDSGLDVGEMDPYRIGTSLGAGGLGLLDLDHTVQSIRVVADCVGPGSRDVSWPQVWKNYQDRINPLTPLKSLSNMAAAQIAITYNARGNCQTIATACTSSAQAIGEAYRQIKHGVADVMIAGGSDSMVNPRGLAAFSSLGVLSQNNEEYKTAARPFDKRRDGFMLGEGAAIFILEAFEHADHRGAVPYGEIVGYASTCDAFRVTDEPPEAWGSIAAMKAALSDASLQPGDIDYVNAHGTGTRMNDKTETYAIKSVFGPRAHSIPVSSTKSMIGHLVAAAGAVEFAACVMAMKNQRIPPTINYREPDPECDLDYVPCQSRAANLDVILSNSFGFGGQNACLILKRISDQE